MMYLKETINSVCKRGVVYGVKGDSVKMIADHENVLIVENERGERFPVKKELVTVMEKQ